MSTRKRGPGPSCLCSSFCCFVAVCAVCAAFAAVWCSLLFVQLASACAAPVVCADFLVVCDFCCFCCSFCCCICLFLLMLLLSVAFCCFCPTLAVFLTSENVKNIFYASQTAFCFRKKTFVSKKITLVFCIPLLYPKSASSKAVMASHVFCSFPLVCEVPPSFLHLPLISLGVLFLYSTHPSPAFILDFKVNLMI